jgi:hypothetical protein
VASGPIYILLMTGVILRHIMAVCPSVARGRLIHGMKDKRIGGYLISWTESFLTAKTVEMVIEGNVLQSHPLVEAGAPQG